MQEITVKQRLTIQDHFHEVIQGRAGKLITEHKVELPILTMTEEKKIQFPIPGMYGGFRYWWDGEGTQVKLITESWCRVVGGSGQRHEITHLGSRLLETGFV